MAQMAEDELLIDELVTLVTRVSQQTDQRRFKDISARAKQTIKGHNYGRTNQFDVENQLTGLEEKLRVFNSDDIADALHGRLVELSHSPNRWTPETLAFLLQLSDQPARRSTIESLHALQPPDPPLPLTWAEIIADEPLDEEGIWEDVDFAAESDADGLEDERLEASLETSALTNDTQASSVHAEDDRATAETCIITDHDTDVETLRKAQFWRRQTPAISGHQGRSRELDAPNEPGLVTELQTIREVLFMLCGLPTSLFSMDQNNCVSLNTRFSVGHIETSTFNHLLESFASVGTAINELRTWTKSVRGSPLLQTLSAAVEERIRDFQSIISELQRQLLTSNVGTTISLMELQRRLDPNTRPLLLLSQTLTGSMSGPVMDENDFGRLERLFNATCEAQVVGNYSDFEFMARLFFQCFQTYAKPIKRWMQSGTLQSNEDGLFIRQMPDTVGKDRGALWHDWYALRETESGTLYAPRFVHAATNKIFTTGKSVVFLQNLTGGALDRVAPVSGSSLDFDTVFRLDQDTELAPFSDGFDVAFDKWIAAQHLSASTILREHLYSKCNLLRALDALDNVYFMKDGALTGNIATAIFDKMDRGKEAWNDRFLLTELFQGAFGTLDCIDAERLTIRSSPGKNGHVQNRRRSVKILGSITVEYTLPWPIQNIVTYKRLAAYQRVFTFLLQVRRAKAIVERLRPLEEGVADVEEANHYYSIRHRLLWFANTLYNYLSELVVATSTAKLRKDMTVTEDVDAMIEAHRVFIAHLEDQCLLSKKLAPIHQAIISLLDLSILFSDAHNLYSGEKIFDISNRSVSVHTSHLRQTRRPRRRGHGDEVSEDTDDEDMQGEDGATDTSYISFQETAYVDRLRKMRAQFERLCGFVSAGLRGVARAGGETQWEMLAEKLEWGFTGDVRERAYT